MHVQNLHNLAQKIKISRKSDAFYSLRHDIVHIFLANLIFPVLPFHLANHLAHPNWFVMCILLIFYLFQISRLPINMYTISTSFKSHCASICFFIPPIYTIICWWIERWIHCMGDENRKKADEVKRKIADVMRPFGWVCSRFIINL